MRIRRFILIWSLASALIPAAKADEVEIKIMSLNMLRFGHGTRFEEQCKWLQKNALNYHIILLQEVMISDANKAGGPDSVTSNYPCKANTKNVNVDPPANAEKYLYVYIGSQLKGKSSYKEAYGFLYDPSTLLADSRSISISQDEFMRPPHFVKFSFKDKSTCQIIVGNFHSVYGKGKIERVKEARNALTASIDLSEKNSEVPVALGGDWNLTKGEIEDQKDNRMHDTTITIVVDTKTTLNLQGDMANSYDHFAIIGPTNKYTFNEGIPQADIRVDPKSWRNTISDHIPITGTMKLTC